MNPYETWSHPLLASCNHVLSSGSCSTVLRALFLDHILRRVGCNFQSHLQNLHHPGCCRLWYLRSLLMKKIRKATRSAKTRVDAMDTTDVKLVMVETWHPSGRVRISQRSAQCGQMSSLYAGASAGTV